MSAMPSTGPSQSPADMLRRIRELQADGPAVGHVTGQHVTSKVLLKRFAEPSGPHRGLICPFRLEYPRARHRLVGPGGCAKADNFVAWASASVERLWKETEDRLPDAGTLFRAPGHVCVMADSSGRRNADGLMVSDRGGRFRRVCAIRGSCGDGC
jgi:hypothetical protein